MEPLGHSGSQTKVVVSFKARANVHGWREKVARTFERRVLSKILTAYWIEHFVALFLVRPIDLDIGRLRPY